MMCRDGVNSHSVVMRNRYPLRLNIVLTSNFNTPNFSAKPFWLSLLQNKKRSNAKHKIHPSSCTFYFALPHDFHSSYLALLKIFLTFIIVF